MPPSAEGVLNLLPVTHIYQGAGYSAVGVPEGSLVVLSKDVEDAEAYC